MSEQLVYRVFEDADLSAVQDLFCRSYFREEPLAVALGVEVPREVQLIIDTHFSMIAEDGVSVLAFDPRDSRALLGARLAILEHGPRLTSFELPKEDPDCAKMNHIFLLLKKLHEGTDFFAKYGVRSLLHFIAVSVEARYQRRGVATRMNHECLAVCKRAHPDVRLVVAEATGHYSQRLYHKEKWTLVNEIAYADYTLNGRRVFTIPEPHRQVQLLSTSTF